MKGVICADELAKDVNGAEALLERHTEHRSEIDAREDSFAATAVAGQKLLDCDHYASEDVKEKLLILGMISHKKSLITIFGHKHKIKNSILKFDIFHEKKKKKINSI